MFGRLQYTSDPPCNPPLFGGRDWTSNLFAQDLSNQMKQYQTSQLKGKHKMEFTAKV